MKIFVISNLVLVMFLILEYRSSQQVITSNFDTENCRGWLSKIDPSVKPSEKPDSDSSAIAMGVNKQLKLDKTTISNDEELFKAIECLLKLEGNKRDSKIIGATSLHTSQTFGASTIEVAALYYISYLYYGKWDHAFAAKLVDEKGFVEDDQIIHKAYTSYRDWYKKLKQLGIAKAREMKLDPLDGTGIGWYGIRPR